MPLYTKFIYNLLVCLRYNVGVGSNIFCKLYQHDEYEWMIGVLGHDSALVMDRQGVMGAILGQIHRDMGLVRMMNRDIAIFIA